MAAWIIRRLISMFSRAAKRGHYPREEAMRNIFKAADIPLPEAPEGVSRLIHVCVSILLLVFCFDHLSLEYICRERIASGSGDEDSESGSTTASDSGGPEEP